MIQAFDEFARITKPWAPQPLFDALDGKPSVYDLDAEWSAHYMGRPRASRDDAFDGDAFLAATQAISYFSTQLPVAEPRRQALPRLYEKVKERLSNPKLLFYNGLPDQDPAFRAAFAGGQAFVPPGMQRYEHHHGVDAGAILHASGYVYFRPALLRAPEHQALLKTAADFSYPNQTYPWAGAYPVWRVFTSDGFARLVDRVANTPVPKGRFEVDPRCSVPELVAQVRERLQLTEASATLFLQVLTLVDCGDAFITSVNRWSRAELDAAAAPLVKAGWFGDKKQPRATRTHSIKGTWEPFKPPHPAVERWKLALYDAEARAKSLAAPLGRLLPTRPVHELFAAAWERFLAEAPGQATQHADAGRDWLAEIRQAPDDNRLRLVYADFLMERGDPRGELIRVQVQRAELPPNDPRDAELARAAHELLLKHQDAWVEAVHSATTAQVFERGFVTAVAAHAPTFVKYANAVFEALPLLETFIFDAGLDGPVPAVHLRKMGECEAFSRFRRLDTTSDHYLSTVEDLEAFLASPHFPQLEWLRLGFHRRGEGFGAAGAKAIAACPKLASLTYLAVEGNSIGKGGLLALLEGLPKLETLRVPFNGLTEATAIAVIDRLGNGLAPALKVLDFENRVDAPFVPKAVSYESNQVSPSTMQAVKRVLAERRGEKFEGAPVELPKVPVLPQTGAHPFAEKAKSARSTCVVCNQRIAKDSVRVGVERELERVGRITAWMHVDCRAKSPEFVSDSGLEARLVENSKGVWP